MSNRAENVALIGAGTAACAVCCAGPILGFLAAIGVGAVAGTLVFGVVGFATATIVGVLLVARRRRRRRRAACAATPDSQPATIGPPRGAG